MIQNHRISCALPCCQIHSGEQTIVSIGLRVTAVALGGMGIIGGILIVCNVPVLTQAGTIAGWSTFSGGCVLVVAGTSFKIVKSYAYEEIRGIHEALDAVQSRDIYSTLLGYLTEARNALIDQRYRPQGKDFNDRVWVLAVYHMMLNSELDTGGCHHTLRIGDFSVMDAEEIKHESDVIYTSDWFSTHECPCKPVSLKKAINALNREQQANVLKEGRPADDQVEAVETELETIAYYLQQRYPFFVSDQKVGIPITYAESGSTLFLPQHIFNLLKEIIKELEIAHVDDLSDIDISKKICDILAIRLLSLTTLSEEDGCLDLEHLRLKFGTIDRGDFFDPRIPNFLVNELTSFDNYDEPFVDTQPLQLALKLRDMDEQDRENLILNTKEGKPLIGEIAFLVRPISSLLLKRYYMKFMLTFEKEKVDTERPLKGTSSHRQINNDIMRHQIHNLIKKHFIFRTPEFESNGTNCILDAILKDIEPDVNYSKDAYVGQLRIQAIRDQMAGYFNAHKEEFIVYFENDKQFMKHVRGLKESFTFLEDIDFEVLARVIDHPLRIYKRDVDAFFVDEEGVPIPSIFGVGCKKEAIDLFEDEGAHYVRLERK